MPSTAVPGQPDVPYDKERFVMALARGFAVVKAFSIDRPAMTLTEVAEVTGLSPAVSRRFLLTLVQLGYAVQKGKRFMLRPRVLELGAAYLGSTNIAEVAQPHLQELRDRTGDSASLTILDGADIIHISHVSTQRLMRFFVASGSRVPAYVSSTGRVLLANLEPAELDAYFESAVLAQRTDETVTSPTQLREVLQRVRRDGYAVVVDELDYGMTSIGVPVYDNRRRVIAGVSCVAPSGYVEPDELVETRLPELQRAAAQIGQELRRFPTFAHSIVGGG